ncbi:hypothetical protein ACWD04_32000 [Streptomyces sp. NPDC002911]
MIFKRSRRLAATAGLTAAASLALLAGTAGTASAAAQAVEYRGAYSSPIACQLAAVSFHAQDGLTYWCDGAYLFRLV